MAVPGTLPQRVFLLAYDPAKGRIRGSHIGAMLRTAALADLYLSGHLVDENGRAAIATRHRHRPADPILTALLDEIAAARPRKWQAWVDRRQHATTKAVRQQAADEGWVRLQRRRFLGIFPITSVTPRDPRVRKELVTRVSRTLREPIGRVDPADAALVAVVAAGELGHVLDRRARRTHKRRIKELTAFSGPVGPALHRAIWEAAFASGG